VFDLFGRKKALKDRMLAAGNLIQRGIWKRLKKRYTLSYDESFSSRLAAAVVNELLFRPPLKEDAGIFYKENKALINDKIGELRTDEQIKYAVTQTLRVCYFCEQMEDASIQTSEKWNANFDIAIRRGVFIDGGETPTPESFIPFAIEFSETA